jgi:hypothetical protein
MNGNGHGDAFVGESPPNEESDERPDLMQAIERAAHAAGEAGHGGSSFDLKVEIDLLEHNQWIKTMRVIVTPHE